MRRFFKIVGWILLALLAACFLLAWYLTDQASLFSVLLWGFVPVGVWLVIDDLIVKPIKAEFRELHRRLDVIERRISK